MTLADHGNIGDFLGGMHAPSKVVAFVAVLLIWAGYSRVIIIFWGYYASVNPILDWAISTLLPDHRVMFYMLIYAHDFLINLLLAMPVGILFRRRSRRNLWGPVAVAVILVFLWDYRQVFWGEATGIHFFDSAGAGMGVITTLGLLPLVYGLAGIRGRSYAT